MKQYSTVRYWIEDLPKRGKITFSQEEVMEQFSAVPIANIRNSLYRLVKKGKIQSVWHGFFVITPVEYGLKGVVPPIEYIDQLMRYLGKEYYVALLSAAALQGASHQQPQEFCVITSSGSMRSKQKHDVRINFTTKKNIPAQYATQLMTNYGYVTISTPELTAFDLVIYVKHVGGINRVATILNELAEALNFENIAATFLKSLNVAIIQRLGYLLDALGYEDLASVLYRKSQEAAIRYRKYPLSAAQKEENLSAFEVNDRWKIIINEDVEVDE